MGAPRYVPPGEDLYGPVRKVGPQQYSRLPTYLLTPEQLAYLVMRQPEFPDVDIAREAMKLAVVIDHNREQERRRRHPVKAYFRALWRALQGNA